MRQIFANNAVALLFSDLSPTDSFIRVQPGLGSAFPQPQPDEYFLVTLESIHSPLSREIVKIVGRSGDVLQVAQRGLEGTPAQSWAAEQTLVDHRITAATIKSALNDYANHSYPQLTDFASAIDHLLSAAPVSGASLYDQPFALTVGAGTTTLTLENQYQPNSIRLFVGGLRQKRGVDFVEISPTEIQLAFELTEDDIAEGQHVVIDYNAA